METKKYPFSAWSKQPDCNIVFAEFRSNLVVDLTIAMELVNNRLDFTLNQNHYFIMDFSNIKHVTQDAKLYLQDPEIGAKNILGVAYIAANPLAALLANIFVKTPKLIPAKFFYSKTEALQWMTLLKQEVVL